MTDLQILLIGLACTAVAALYVALCERVRS
jgi:hypothetical protein